MAIRHQCLACVLLLPMVVAWSLPGQAQSPPGSLTGQILDQANHRPLGFVSVSVIGRPYGTVADAYGRFTLILPLSYDADSVRFSLVGYASRTACVHELRRTKVLQIQAQAVPLAGVRVTSKGLKRRVLGNNIGRANARVFIGFERSNMAGNQMGQRISIMRPAFLQETSFSIRACTYDTVWLRLNICRVKKEFPAENILPTPIYLKISKEQSRGRTYINLRPYKLYLTSDIVICLELVRALGTGEFYVGGTMLGGGPCYLLEQTPGPTSSFNEKPSKTIAMPALIRKQPDGPWARYPLQGIDLDATILELPD